MRSAMAGSSAGALQCSRSVQNAAEANDLIQNPLRHFALAHFRKCEVAAVAGEERDDIRVAIESRAFGGNVVGYDEVGILRGKLFSRVLRDMIRFRRKPHDNFLTLVSRYLRQNVSGRLESNRQQGAALLDLFRG